MIWDEEFETLPREALEALQLKRLVATAERVYATVPFYKKKFDESGVKPSDIKSLKDLRRLPFTTKSTCGTTTPSAFSPCPWNRWCASMPLRGRPANRPWSAIPAGISTPGRS